MARYDIAVEMGTSFTSIFLSGSGVVLKEPTVIAFLGEQGRKNVRAGGLEAYEMLGRTPEKTFVTAPVREGVIADTESAVILLTEFLKKVIPPAGLFVPRINAIVCVPCGLSEEERNRYNNVCKEAGIRDVTLVESIIAAAVGIDLPISSTYGGVAVNIGGGITDIAVMSLSGIISGCSINVGGDLMDRALMEYIEAKYSMQIGELTARHIKKEIASLYQNDGAMLEVNGVDLRTKNPASAVIKANDTREAYIPYYLSVAEAVEDVINGCPPEIAADVYRTGIHITGGSACIPGLEELFKNKLRLPVSVAEDCRHAVIAGAGKLLNNVELMNEILMQ